MPPKVTAPRRVFVLRLCRVVHREAGTQQTKHHRDEASGHETRRAFIKLACCRVSKLGEEDPLRTFYQLTVNDLAAAKRSSRREDRRCGVNQTARACAK